MYRFLYFININVEGMLIIKIVLGVPVRMYKIEENRKRDVFECFRIFYLV